MLIDDEKRHIKLIEALKEAIQLDNSLREKYEVGEKFRFVRERLQKLLVSLEKALAEIRVHEAEEKKQEEESAKDILVYVYLYNAQGVVLRSWLNMLTPKVFYEYSINRPIYSDHHVVEGFVRAKANKMQHAYLTVAINPDFVVNNPNLKPIQDASGNPLIRVKEGSLRFEKLVSLTHNGDEYMLNARGELVKKNLD